MKKSDNDIRLNNSEKYFVNDLYEIILSSADNPALMMSRLSEILREFIGAREIILFECDYGENVSHRMISKIQLVDVQLERHLSLAAYTHERVDTLTYFEADETEDTRQSLTTLGYRNVLVVPIPGKERRLGCMHVFDIFDLAHLDQMTRLIRSITPLLGVILENYQLFERMDQLIDEKTASVTRLNRDLSSLIETLPDLILRTDSELNIIDVYNCVSHRYYGSQLRAGSRFDEYIPKTLYDTKRQALSQLGDGKTAVFTEEVPNADEPLYLENRIKRTGEHFLHIIRNITDQVVSDRKIDFMNQRDQLTGLYNRTMFFKLLAQFQSMNTPTGVLLVDMNGLKLLNETLGFSEGDRYLVLLSKTCKNQLPNGAFLCRVGDDELAFLIPSTSQRQMTDLSQRLTGHIEALNESKLKMFPLSIAYGYYIDFKGGQAPEVIFSQAEKNLNQDKLLHSESKKSSIVDTLAKALEARDFITDGHADRMEQLMITFGQVQEFDNNGLNRLRLFAKFHDIGKVGVSDTLLFKPGKLTFDEMQEMRKHSEIGYRIALTSADLHPIADLILKHHECYDGSGYPIGLSGKAIPMECRMLAIVDAYDAITNDRPYRKAARTEEAVRELVAHSGTQFDPDLVDLFIKKVIK